MSAEAKITVAIRPDASGLGVTIQREGGGAAFLLSTAEADALLCILATARPALKPELPASLNGQHVHPIENYQWSVPGMKVDGKRQLFLRHPGFGWLLWLMPDHDAAEVAKWLVKPLDDTPKGSA